MAPSRIWLHICTIQMCRRPGHDRRAARTVSRSRRVGMMDPMRSLSAALGALVVAVLIAACGSAATPAPAGSLGAVPASAAVDAVAVGWLAIAVAPPVGDAEARRPPRRPRAREAAARQGRRRDADEAERRAGVVGRRVGRPGDQGRREADRRRLRQLRARLRRRPEGHVQHVRPADPGRELPATC